ncbi:MAG: hypothetical protein MI700_13875, partial [Balneolales bacterium]|nr:hypothetical protein [Balneolales bacterium]
MRLLLFILLILWGTPAWAQSLSIHAIEVYFPAYTGTGQLDTFQDFIANTKEPLLFQTNFAETTRNSLELTYAGFDIDFVFRND